MDVYLIAYVFSEIATGPASYPPLSIRLLKYHNVKRASIDSRAFVIVSLRLTGYPPQS
jgi:hypothetical protein